jgi:hypothetical protein
MHSYFNVSGRATPHWYVGRDGEIEMYIDSDFRSTANLDGNGSCLTVETWDGYGASWSGGGDGPPWTPKQVEALAKIAAWAHEKHGIPLDRLPSSRPGTRGIGWHRQGCDGNYEQPPGQLLGGRVSGGERWSTSAGKVCPTTTRIKQVDGIINRAKQLAGTGGKTGDGMRATTILSFGKDSSGRPIRMTARMKQAFDKACDQSGVTPDIVQGAYMGSSGAAASAGTHQLSGCLDLRTWNLTTDQRNRWMHAARSIGWAAWYRTSSQGFDPHMHVLLLGEKEMHADARAQEEQYRQGLNGLASRGRDDFWRPDPIPTYQYQEKDEQMTQDDIDKIAVAVVKRLLGADLTPDNDEQDMTVRGALNKLANKSDTPTPPPAEARRG